MFTLLKWAYRFVIYGLLLPGFLFAVGIGIYSAIDGSRGVRSQLDNPYLTVKTLDDAVRAVYIEMKTIEGQRQYCSMQGENARLAGDATAVGWWSQNHAAVVAVNSYLRTPDGSRIGADAGPAIAAAVARFQSQSATDKVTVCIGAVQDVVDHRRDVATEAPAAAKLLADYLSKDPASAERLDQENRMIGCMKALVKEKKMNYDAGLKFCPCFMDAFETSLSDSERKQFWEVDQGQISRLSGPQQQRIAPKFRQCLQSAQPAAAK